VNRTAYLPLLDFSVNAHLARSPPMNAKLSVLADANCASAAHNELRQNSDSRKAT
jgi:hypothetical protein